MRLAETADAEELMALYQEAVVHANNVGTIDWPNPIPRHFVDDLIATNELYCFEGNNAVQASAKISEHADERIWGRDATPALYIAKVAAGQHARGTGFFSNRMLPEILSSRNLNISLRLDCLAENFRLKRFYLRLGFMSLGDITFYSEKQQKDISVTKLELKAKP